MTNTTDPHYDPTLEEELLRLLKKLRQSQGTRFCEPESVYPTLVWVNPNLKAWSPHYGAPEESPEPSADSP